MTDPSQMTPEEITRAYAVEVCGLQVNAPTFKPDTHDDGLRAAIDDAMKGKPAAG